MVLIMVVALAAAAVAASPIGASDKPEIVAAFYPLAYAAEQVVGSAYDVRNLTPAGAEPHDLELTPSDIRAVYMARLVLYLGRGFQPAVEKAVQAAHVRAVDLLAGQPLATGRVDGEIGPDPHVWLDPLRYEQMARRIASAVGRPKAAAPFAARLRALDQAFRTGLAHCKRRTIVTSHAAFGYLARRYALRQVALEGLSPEAEPSPRAVAKLIEEVRRTHATTVFFETLVSPKLAETVAREAGARTAVLDPLEGLADDALDRGATYFTVMRANLRALRLALGCRR
jgi:zinc transport system substrate-binding protein